jgi:dynein intermediate chain
MNKEALLAKQAEIERKKQELAARKNRITNKEDDVIARAKELFSEPKAAQEVVEKQEEAPAPVEKKTNQDYPIVPIGEILKRIPKPKPEKKHVEIQCDLDSGDAILNIDNDTSGKETLEETTKGQSKDQVDSTPTHATITAASLVPKQTKIFTREEQVKLFETEKFEKFIRYASKCVENILDKKVDILNMIGEDDLSQQLVRTSIKHENQIDDVDKDLEAVKVVQTLPCLPRMNGCMIADLQWNPCLPDLVMVNYSRRVKEEDNFTQYPGKLLIWSASNSQRPEFILQAKTRVTRAQFDPYNPAVIYGGMSNGSLAMWDVRESSTPVVKVHPSNESHFTPIYGLQVVGTRNSYNIISMSSEGKICVWEPSNMSYPILQIPLIAPKAEVTSGRANIDSNLPMSPLSMCAPPGHFSRVFVGGIDRGLFHINLNSQASSSLILQNFNDAPTSKDTQSQGIDFLTEMHKGPICGLSYLTNYSGKSNLTQGMLLSCSFDWTVKLWYPQLGTRCLGTFTSHESVVSDVAWNSMHPGKFVSCGADGKVLGWNLLRSTALPVFEHKVVGAACTKLHWNIDGRHLAVGDSEGRVHILKQKKAANQYDEDAEKQLKEKLSYIALNSAGR